MSGSMWPATLAVAAGGALGSVGRLWLGWWADRVFGAAFPWGTLIINVAGSFAIGLIATATLPGGPAPAGMTTRLFAMAGLCGGFTTFSAFSLQVLVLAREGQWRASLAYVLGSVVLCVVAVTAGHALGLRAGGLRAP